MPHDLSFASYPNTELEPHERYTLLYAAERMGMRRTGKRAQYEAAAASGDALATLYQDLDWADEVLHVHLARRVLLTHVYETTKELDETGEHIWEVFDRVPRRTARSPARIGGTSSTPGSGLSRTSRSAGGRAGGRTSRRGCSYPFHAYGSSPTTGSTCRRSSSAKLESSGPTRGFQGGATTRCM